MKNCYDHFTIHQNDRTGKMKIVSEVIGLNERDAEFSRKWHEIHHNDSDSSANEIMPSKTIYFRTISY